jgi:uncharacterized protein YndB with AHSA1/START domain
VRVVATKSRTLRGMSHLEITRALPAPRLRVFRLFSDPEQLSTWWGPDGFEIPALDYAPSVGGTYRIEMQPPEGDAFFLSGEFREVEPPRRLAFTFVWEEPDPDDVETLAELSFEERGKTTEVILRQGPFKTKARLALHQNGWSDGFDKIMRILLRRGTASDEHG